MNKHLNPLRNIFIASLALSTPFATMAIEDGFYAAVSIGTADTSSSDNAGRFTTDFTTGTVTGVNPPLTLPEGADVGWNTEFDKGDTYSIVLGNKNGSGRWELEYTEIDSDVETHTGVEAGGLALGAIDAGVLISGNVGDLGVSVADLVAAGQGSLETSGIFVNYFYDLANSSSFTPFLGVGVGYASTDVNYRPSGVEIINDSDDNFAYQVMAGASFSLTDNLDIVGTLRYRDFGDAEVEASLFPATFDVENQSTQFDIGLRYGF